MEVKNCGPKVLSTYKKEDKTSYYNNSSLPMSEGMMTLKVLRKIRLLICLHDFLKNKFLENFIFRTTNVTDAQCIKLKKEGSSKIQIHIKRWR